MTLKRAFEIVRRRIQSDIFKLETHIQQEVHEVEYLKATLMLMDAEAKLLFKNQKGKKR